MKIASSDVNEAASTNDELLRLRAENSRLTQQLQQQQRESLSRHSLGGDSVQLDFIHAQQELSRCKEALIGSLLICFAQAACWFIMAALTMVRTGHCFAAVVYIVFLFSPPNLRVRLADRHQTLPHGRRWPGFIKFGQKFEWPLPPTPKFDGPKNIKFRRDFAQLNSWLDRECLRNATT